MKKTTTRMLQKSYIRFCFYISLTVVLATTAAAQTQTISITRPLQPISIAKYGSIDGHINEVAATIDDHKGAEDILRALVIQDANGHPVGNSFADKDFYCIIHVLSLADPTGAPPIQTVRAQHWYLYHNGKLSPGSPEDIPRLYGAKMVTLLYLHLNKKTNYEPLYEVKIVKKTPAYLQHLLGLANLFTSTGSPAAAAAGDTDHAWASYTFTVDHRPSDMTIEPNYTTAAGVTKLGDAQKFDNEGKYRLDFSVGVPVRKISQLSFDSTNGLVTAKEVDKTDIMAFVNIHPIPIDIKRTGYNKIPHFLGGVAIANKPLDKIFVGAGFGPVVANFYVGALFVKQDALTSLSPGDAATPGQVSNDVRRRYKAQVGFGLNLPIGAIVEKLKK